MRAIEKLEKRVDELGRTLEHQSKLLSMDEDKRNRLLWTLRFGLLNRGVGFSPIALPLNFIEFSDLIYYDGLTKDQFMHRLFEVRKTLLFIFWMIERELGEPEPTTKLRYIS